MIRFSTIVTDAYGVPIVEGGSNAPFTLGKLCVTALQSPHQEDAGQATGSMATRFMLAVKIANAEASNLPANLSPEEVQMVKLRLEKIYAHAGLVGRAWFLLDGGGVDADVEVLRGLPKR